MLYQPLVNKLHELRMEGMAKALQEQLESNKYDELSFQDRLGLLIDRETTSRENKRLQVRLKKAKLRYPATIEDIDFRIPRGLDKQLVLTLSSCRWIRDHHNCIIIGPTGVGKSYLACALVNQACREGYDAQYIRIAKLFEEFAIAKADGRYRKLLNSFTRLDMLVIDDLGLDNMSEEQRRVLFEIIEDRAEMRSTLIASQMPIEKWYPVIGDPTLADAILDRIVHSSHKMILKGESLRKRKKPDLGMDYH
jgi:DNA replication protein DnaC